MFEDFFNVVKKRFNDGEEEYKPPMFKCPRCQGTSPLSKYEELHRVCPKCNYHGRLSSTERIAITVDKGSFRELNGNLKSANPLDFPDYTEKQAELRASNGTQRGCYHRYSYYKGLACSHRYNGLTLHDGLNGKRRRREDNTRI